MKTNWPTAIIFASIALVFSAILLVNSPAISQGQGASYMVASGGGSYVWRVNTMTGSVSYCVRRSTTTTSSDYLAENAPNCSAESAPVAVPVSR